MKKIGMALLLVLLAGTPGWARSVEDSVLERLDQEHKQAQEAFERRQTKLDAQMQRQEFREARGREVRAFLRALIDRDFDAFAGMLCNESRNDVLFLFQTPLQGRNLEQPGMEVPRQIMGAKSPEALPPSLKPLFLDNFTRAYVQSSNSRSGLSLRDVDLLDFDFQISDPNQGKIQIGKRLQGKAVGRDLQMIEEGDRWKIDLGLRVLRPQLEQAIKERK